MGDCGTRWWRGRAVSQTGFERSSLGRWYAAQQAPPAIRRGCLCILVAYCGLTGLRGLALAFLVLDVLLELAETLADLALALLDLAGDLGRFVVGSLAPLFLGLATDLLGLALDLVFHVNLRFCAGEHDETGAGTVPVEEPSLGSGCFGPDA